MNWTWQVITAASCVSLACLVGLGLTVITLPGTWLMLLVAVGAKAWQPGMFSWWTIGIAAGLALLGELIEFLASAAGASKGGASKKGALGAVVGALIGAVVGAPFFPLGSIGGAAIGAGVGAVLVERGISKKTWTQSAQAGAGAAAGRLLATLAKTIIAACMASLLVFTAWAP